MTTVVVSGNCQTGGVAAALTELMPRSRVIADPWPGSFQDEAQELAFFDRVKTHAGVWVHSSAVTEAVILKHGLRSVPSLRLYAMPNILFDAFHPDLSYIICSPTGDLVAPHYNSAIVAWAYQRKLEPQEAAALFSARTFGDLGYFDYWTGAVDGLRGAFTACGWGHEFDRFFLRVKRTGVFMHSFNHPKSHVLVELGKMIAARINGSDTVFGREVVIPDGLASFVWPIYPPVADSLAMEGGSYCWRFDDLRFGTLLEYIEFAYANYRPLNVQPGDFSINSIDKAVLDRVLEAGMKAVT